MQIEINCSSPTYGGASVGNVGDFLVDGLPDVGSGITTSGARKARR